MECKECGLEFDIICPECRTLHTTNDHMAIEKIVNMTIDCYNNNKFWEKYLAGKKLNKQKIVDFISSADL